MKISVRQICFILIFYTAASKLLLYPTMLSGYSGRDLLFSALINFVVQGIVIWAVAYLSSKTDKTLFELLKDTFGEIPARIIFGFFAAFFIVCTIIPLFEQKLYVHAIFYDTVPTVLVFLPIFIFTIYAGSKSFKNIGCCADVCMPIFLISMAFIFFMSFTEVDFSNLLPVLKTPASKVFGGSMKTALNFLEPAYLLMFLGHFRYKKGDAAKMTLSYAAGAAIVLLFLAVFYGIYGELTYSRQFAISKTSLYFSAIDVIGRIDLYTLYALEVVMLFALVLNIQLAVQCLIKCTGWDCPEILSVAVNAVLATILLTCNHFFTALQSFFANWLWIVVVIFAVIAPLSAWALKRRER
ncbi:MAG: GerAB/ArcD/ProY family transporter [Clostridiales bacterium]|nr:GerAB/ArcD/ProY family transporter [Clostridiales bacterium]